MKKLLPIIIFSLVALAFLFNKLPPLSSSASAQAQSCRWERADGSLPTGPTGSHLYITWSPECKCPSTEGRLGYTVYKLNSAYKWIWKGGCAPQPQATGSQKCYELTGEEKLLQRGSNHQSTYIADTMAACGNCSSGGSQRLYPDYQELVWKCPPPTATPTTEPPTSTPSPTPTTEPPPPSPTATTTPPTYCATDFDQDGDIDLDDLQVFINDVAKDCRVETCPSDFNGNGEINLSDLQALITDAANPQCNTST